MVDFHSHILPGVDDGSTCVEMSVAMLKMETEQGVQTVVATPHFYADRNTPAQFLAKRQEAMEQLQKAMEKEEGMPRIVLGAEVSYFRGMSESEAMWDLRIADTNYILVEMPLPPWDRRVYEELTGLINKQNLHPIIAHIDRYLHPLHGRGILKHLQGLPVLLQANTGFFTRKRTEKRALQLVQNGYIHLLGTDCHNLKGRAPNMDEALDRIGETAGGDALDQIRYFEQHVLRDVLRNHCTSGANI